jgi:N-hydroxyarylamine O-acetyltransferase
MDVNAYLQRIGYTGTRKPSIEPLRQLHRLHMLAVPFENLDIHLGRAITLSLPSFYDKIVHRHRGGFCYELNGLFGWLLEQLGFPVTIHSGRVFENDRSGPEFDHLVLLVRLEELWIADVGFGDSFLEPIRLEGGAEEEQQSVSYRVTQSGPDKVVQRRRPAGDWEPQYVFSLAPRRLEEFSGMCSYQQTSSESVFTRKTVCSLPTLNGRITLANGRFVVTAAGKREERKVATEEEYRVLLRSHFGINLGDGARVDRLMSATPTISQPI